MIAIERMDGGVSILYLTPDAEVEVEVKKWKACHAGEYVSHHEIGSVPADRTFRNAWKHTNDHIVVDMGRAREIHRERLRQLRAPKLKALDIEYAKADEAGNTAEKRRIALLRQQLRDVTMDPRIDSVATPEELKAVVPEVLKGE